MQKEFIELFRIKNTWNNVLYIHTPFCLQKCKYCIYPSSQVFTQDDFNHFYNETLPRQIREYDKILQEVRFQEIYFGGGTPTIANANTLEKMFNSIPRFDEIPIKSIEAHPYTLTDEHIDLFRKYKFTYVSLGIQSLSRRILKENNRLFVSRKRLKEICNKFESTNIIYNFDLICYLDKEDKEDIAQFFEDLEYVANVLRPVAITVHSNSKAKRSETKTRLLICAIKKLIVKYPEYRCVNSLLQMKDVKLDKRHNAEYKLMRKSFDFFNYMWSKYPYLPVFGSNILALGESKVADNKLFSYVGPCRYEPRTDVIVTTKTPFFSKRNFDSVRRELRLPYQINKYFFRTEEDKKRFLSLFIPVLTRKKHFKEVARFFKKIQESVTS